MDLNALLDELENIIREYIDADGTPNFDQTRVRLLRRLNERRAELEGDVKHDAWPGVQG